MSYDVSASDIEARWRPLTPAETTVAATKLADAGVMLDAALPGLAAAVDADTVSIELVRITLVEMVVRYLRNPDALKSETLGNYSYSRDAGEGLMLLDSDLTALSAALGVTSRGAFTISPYYTPPVAL